MNYVNIQGALISHLCSYWLPVCETLWNFQIHWCHCTLSLLRIVSVTKLLIFHLYGFLFKSRRYYLTAGLQVPWILQFFCLRFSSCIVDITIGVDHCKNTYDQTWMYWHSCLLWINSVCHMLWPILAWKGANLLFYTQF